ncbi:MAG TPA: holo-ACP synthase [Phycisphaerales bacterium]|nr:holo-ACP synthase [Phycisphaerales bacterium]
MSPPVTILGHGIDLVEVARVRGLFRAHGERFGARCFTPEERDYCLGHRDPAPHLAGRLATKEAAFKALAPPGGPGAGTAWTDFEVVRHATGQPLLRVQGRAAEIARARGITGWLVSLSHTGTHAVASVIATGPA